MHIFPQMPFKLPGNIQVFLLKPFKIPENVQVFPSKPFKLSVKKPSKQIGIP